MHVYVIHNSLLLLCVSWRAQAHTRTHTNARCVFVSLCVVLFCNEHKQWKLICSLWYRVYRIKTIPPTILHTNPLFRLLTCSPLPSTSTHSPFAIRNFLFSDPFFVAVVIVALAFLWSTVCVSVCITFIFPSHHYHHVEVLCKTKSLVLNITLYIARAKSTLACNHVKVYTVSTNTNAMRTYAGATEHVCVCVYVCIMCDLFVAIHHHHHRFSIIIIVSIIKVFGWGPIVNVWYYHCYFNVIQMWNAFVLLHIVIYRFLVAIVCVCVRGNVFVAGYYFGVQQFVCFEWGWMFVCTFGCVSVN